MSTEKEQKAINRAADRLLHLVEEAGHEAFATITRPYTGAVGSALEPADSIVVVRLGERAEPLRRAVERLDKAYAAKLSLLAHIRRTKPRRKRP